MKRRSFLKGLFASVFAAPVLAATLRQQPTLEISDGFYGSVTNEPDGWTTASADDIIDDIRAAIHIIENNTINPQRTALILPPGWDKYL